MTIRKYVNEVQKQATNCKIYQVTRWADMEDMTMDSYQAADGQDFTQKADSKDATATAVASITLNAMEADRVERLQRH